MRCLTLAVLFCAARAWSAGTATLCYDSAIAPVRFAASEIRSALAARGTTVVESCAAGTGVHVALRVEPAAGASGQAYSVRADGSRYTATGRGAAGAMYAGLDIAEAVRLGIAPRAGDYQPHIERRGIKFNIPLDVRTPSYSDNSTSAQLNIPEMWSFDFWREFLDDMARHRYNVLTLWNLHPWPSLVRIPEFPEVALDDVQRTLVPMDDTYSHSGSDMVRPELLRRVEVVHKMSIDEKIAFWRDVMQYARDRGIETYWFTWNMFTFGADGKHGITSAQDNPRTIEYFRAAVREMVLTYPLLAGFGITAGERMEKRNDEFATEKWLWKTYGEGILDAKKLQPKRHVRLIHRYHMTAQSEILNEWQKYPDTLDLSFKYAIAHMYSIPNPPFLQPALPHLGPKLRTWLTVRDDDYYSFRWGDPEYARHFIKAIPGKDKVAGFYMGPDGDIWGRETMSVDPETPRQLTIRKRWYAFLLWGRLSYDPSIPDSHFEQILAARFPQAPAQTLYRAWAEASKILPRITSFMWGDIDLRWFPEANLSHPRHRGFYTVHDYITGGTMPGSGVLDIVEWRKRKLAGQAMNGATPLDVAADLERHAATTLKLVPSIGAGNKELRETLGDLVAMAHLGHYYAAKIRGASELALFDKTSKPEHREAAIAHLRTALLHWKRYAGAYTMQYTQPRLYNRVGWVDIPSLAGKVEEDILIARAWSPGTVPDTAPVRPADTPFRK